MATYECSLQGDFDDFLDHLDRRLLGGSPTASAEGRADLDLGPTRVAVRVYERYSFVGGNRLSLNLTPAGAGDDLRVVAVTSGGSQAMFWKINTFGEDSFLAEVARMIEHYQSQDG